jgi:hypothetical protein
VSSLLLLFLGFREQAASSLWLLSLGLEEQAVCS